MIRNIRLIYFVRFFLLVILQGILFNEIQFSGYINPFPYLLFILLMPLNTPIWLLLVVAFFLGLGVDIFSDTGGIHAASTVFLAYLRPVLLTFISSKDERESSFSPSINRKGILWFLVYTMSLTFAHHFVLFNIEVFRLSELFYTLSRVLLSSIFTVIIIMLSELLFRKSEKQAL